MTSEGITATFVKRFPGGPAIRIEDLETSGKAAVTVLFGASGAGKTTVLRCLAGLERPEEGAIQFGKEVWSDAKRGIFVPARKRNVGFVPQDYALFPHLSVEDNVGYGVARRLPSGERHQRTRETMAWLGLAGLEKRLPGELSGGQQQRVALARAVVRRPQLLLLDEPLSALDVPTRLRVRGELAALLRRLGVPTLLVTHDRNEALALGSELIVMDAGKILQRGPAHELFSRPANLPVAGIVGVETVQSGRVAGASGGLVTVLIGNRKLVALAPDLPADAAEVWVCIRAEDVILVKGEPGQSSPRNSLPAVVRGLSREGPMMRIELDCGFPLAALLTKQACEELALVENDSVLALIKAPQIHLIQSPERMGAAPSF